MSKLSRLKAATSLIDLANILGLPAKALAYTLYVLRPNQRYTSFTIPKKSGGTRQIDAPIKRLKGIQNRLADTLVECRRELDLAIPRKLVSHAFKKEGSILTNAGEHRARRYVLNLDIEGFFPCFNFGRVRGFFIANRSFALHPDVATVIAQIACHNNSLPQGSPSSPVISDLIAHLLDIRLVRLAKTHKCSYSRYVDDLTISTNQKTFPIELAYQLDNSSSAWILGDSLLYELSHAGFSANHRKTRMQYRGSRQIVTGLTVNTKVNIRSEYYRSARSMCNSLFTTGAYSNPRSGAPGVNPTAGSIEALEGIVNHIYFIKRHEAQRSMQKSRSEKKDAIAKHADRRGFELLYSRLLFFKKFVAPKKPLILAEGKTDYVYLRAAIKHSPQYVGALRTIANGKSNLNVSFFKHSHLTRSLLGLGAGSGYFPEFMSGYDKRVSEFKFAPLEHPVIIVIDNDDGARGVFGFLKDMKTNISFTTTTAFYRVSRNLYVIKTPEIGPKSQIEDLFDAGTLKTVLNGKTFNKSNDNDTATEYGKALFADHVIAPNAANISFTGFAQLLDRMVEAIAHHQMLVAKGLV